MHKQVSIKVYAYIIMLLGTSLFCFFFHLFFFPAILLFFTYYAPYFAQELYILLSTDLC